MGGKRVVLYTATGCRFSAALRAELREKGREIVEINVTERPDAIPELLKLTRGERVVPVLVDGGRISIGPHGGSRF